jgi:hypothetical protein
MSIQAIGTGFNAGLNTRAVSGRTDAGNTGSASGVAAATLPEGSTSISDIYYYDPRDTNKDGYVSRAEELAYALKHPGEYIASDAAASGSRLPSDAKYTRQGSMASGTPRTSTIIDLSV